MKVVQCSVLVNFVLLNALLVNAQTDDGPTSDVLKKFLADLSDESKTIFNNLNDVGKKKMYMWKSDLNAAKKERDTVKEERDTLKKERDTLKKERDTLKKERDLLERMTGYNSFSCAVQNIKNNMETMHIQYEGDFLKWEAGWYNPNRNKYLRNFEAESSLELEFTELAFQTLEAKLISNGKKLDWKHRACRKIPNFYNEMCALLTRFDDDIYKRFLRPESINHAEAITKKIFKPDFDFDQKQKAIVDFASRYARIRHGADLFEHQYRLIISAKTEEIAKQTTHDPSLLVTNTETMETPTLPRVLDDIGFLKAWNFTAADLIFLNFVSETVRLLNDRIYLPYNYDVLDREGNQLKGLLPVAKENACPSTPGFSLE